MDISLIFYLGQYYLSICAVSDARQMCATENSVTTSRRHDQHNGK